FSGPAHLIFYMGADDFVEGCVRDEAELLSASNIEVARPARNDALDDGIGLAADQPHCSLTAKSPQRRDLVRHRRGQAWHVEAAAGPHALQTARNGLEYKADRPPRT